MSKGNYYNLADRFAVAVIKGGTVVGHIPRKISNICSIFIRKGGSIFCLTTGSRRFSSDLPQGGLESLYSRSFTTARFCFLDGCKAHRVRERSIGARQTHRRLDN